jgi:hypothetical protein
MLKVIMLSGIMHKVNAECRYAEYHCDKCRYAEYHCDECRYAEYHCAECKLC